MRLLKHLCLASAVLLAVASVATADGYRAWHYSKKFQRAECVYAYQNKSGGTSYNMVMRYPVNDSKVGWDYFANGNGQVWAKCMNWRHPNYQKGVMQWCLCEPNGKVKEEMPKGACPTPKDGKNPITDDVPNPEF